MKVYEYIAQELGRYARVKAAEKTPGGHQFQVKSDDIDKELCEWVRKNMPRGSGIDCGTELDMDRSNPNKLVFIVSYHHMDEHGGYDGWTEHKIIVVPDLAFQFNLGITGRNRNDIKDYLHSVYAAALNEEKAK